jgi:MFS family permease
MMTNHKKHSLRIHWGWVVLGTSCITLFITYSIRTGAYSVLLPEMIKDLHMTKAEAGLIKSAFSLTYLLFAPLMGWLTDHIGGRKVISIFCLFLAGGTFLMSKAKDFHFSALFFSIVGVGAAAIWVPNATLIPRWFSVKKRGLVLGILNASAGAGSGSMGLILPVIVMRYNWRFGWFILGAIGFSLFWLNGLLLRDRPEQMGLSPWGGGVGEVGGKVSPAKKMGYVEIVKASRFWIIGASYFVIAYGTYAIVDFIVTYGTIELKISYSIASFFITVIAFSGIIGGVLLLGFSDYIGRKKSLMFIHTMVALSILFIILGGNSVLLLVAGVGCFGFLYGAIFPLFAACVRDYFPKEVAGTVLGLLTIFYGGGMMVAPILTGHLADITGTFKWPFGLGAFASLVAGFLIGLLRKSSEIAKGSIPNFEK